MSKINPWIKFVKDFREKNSGMSYKDSLKEASKVYKSQGSGLSGGQISGGSVKSKKKPMKMKKKPMKKNMKMKKGGAILSGVTAPVDLIIKKVKKVKK